MMPDSRTSVSRMHKPFSTLLTTLLLFGCIGTTSLLQGCAPVVVGGVAATSGAIAHDRRTTGSFVEDQAIKLKIRNRIYQDSSFDGDNANIGIDAFNGLVLLTGTVIADDLRERAEGYSREVEKVRIVYNEISIGERDSWGNDGDDLLVTTRIKAALFDVDGADTIDPLRVSVTTAHGVVYLMGLVTHQEADAVTETTRRITGVKKVIRLFEYTD